MTYVLSVILSLSIAFPAIAGAIRLKKINAVYYPFVYCIWLGLLNEMLGVFLAINGYSNAFNNNLYVLAESILFTWLFYKWGLPGHIKKLFTFIILIYVIVWIGETFLFGRMKHNVSFFRMMYAFIIVLLSIQGLYWQLILEKRNILKNSIFLICTGFIIYYTYKIIVGIFWLNGLRASLEFQLSINMIMAYINCFVNLIYGFAVLWMPTKHRFSLPS